MKFCQNCGRKINNNINYCPHCGAEQNIPYHQLNKSTHKSIHKSPYILYGIVAIIVLILCVMGGTYLKHVSKHHAIENKTEQLANDAFNKPGYVNAFSYNRHNNTATVVLNQHGKHVLSEAYKVNLINDINNREGDVNSGNSINANYIGPKNYSDNPSFVSSYITTPQKNKFLDKFKHIRLSIAQIKSENPRFRLNLSKYYYYLKLLKDVNSMPSNNEWLNTKKVSTNILPKDSRLSHQLQYNHSKNLVKVVVKPNVAKKLNVDRYCIHNIISPDYVGVTTGLNNIDNDINDTEYGYNSNLGNVITNDTYKICKLTHNYGVHVKLIAKAPKLHINLDTHKTDDNGIGDKYYSDSSYGFTTFHVAQAYSDKTLKHKSGKITPTEHYKIIAIVKVNGHSIADKLSNGKYARIQPDLL